MRCCNCRRSVRPGTFGPATAARHEGVSDQEVAAMSVETWDIDQAVICGLSDEDLEGRCAPDRFGVIGQEELAGEPLDVALAQEEADVAPKLTGDDDQWVFVDYEDSDCPLDALAGDGPEAGAMHVVTP